MNIIPKKKITFRTSLTKDDVRERLAKISGYKISIDGDFITIVRIINYRNSFLPQIKGNISDLDNSCAINVTM